MGFEFQIDWISIGVNGKKFDWSFNRGFTGDSKEFKTAISFVLSDLVQIAACEYEDIPLKDCSVWLKK